MAYSEIAALRLHDALGRELTQKRMMGGLIFLIGGNMVAGVNTEKNGHERYMFRVGKPNMDTALAISGTRPMIHNGRTMSGFLFIDEADCGEDVMQTLAGMSRTFVESLPRK